MQRAPCLAGLALALLCAPPVTGGAQCVGDCKGNGTVDIGDLITGVNIALGSLSVSACQAFENAQGTVDIAQIIQGVNNALNGCPGAPTATIVSPPSTVTPPVTRTASPSATPTRTRVPTNTRAATATPTVAISVCGGPVSSLPVVCNLTVIPNPVSRSGTIAFQFGVSDLDGDINLVCIQLTYPPLEPQTTCTQIVPSNRLINAIETSTPVAASVLQFGTYQAAVQAFDAAGRQSNVITATFQVQ
ncbi:MAG: hypothetical protein ACRD3Q_11100 [Terriglobales bacterium]